MTVSLASWKAAHYTPSSGKRNPVRDDCKKTAYTPWNLEISDAESEFSR